MLHTAWVQPLDSVQAKKGIYLHSGMDLQNQGLSLGNEDGTSEERRHLWQLEGVVSLKRSRFFHLNQELLLRLPVEEDVRHNGLWDSTEQYLKTFRLKTATRMKVGQLYYIDHPVFGVLAQVTPTDTPSLVSTDLTQEPEEEP